MSTYKVESGDTLSAIAARFHTTVAVLASTNHISNPNLINTGETLTIPDDFTPAPPKKKPAATTYKVKGGDTLSGIAKRFHTTTAKLVSLNKIANADVISVGQVLHLTAATKPATHPAPPKNPAPKPNPGKPYKLYDSVSPGAIPAGAPAAVYANGKYAASAASVKGHHPLLWIDVNGSDPNANVLDVEPGDATPADSAKWARERLTRHPGAQATIYTMKSDWDAVKASIGGLPKDMRSHVNYWIADPTGVQHMVPGSSATQWYWGKSVDESEADGSFQK